jgi:hypothetical protein
VEARAGELGQDAQGVKQLREQHSVSILGEIEALLLANLHTVLPASLL